MTVLIPEAAEGAEDVVGMGAKRRAQKTAARRPARAGGGIPLTPQDNEYAAQVRRRADRRQARRDRVTSTVRQAPANYARQAGYVGSRAQIVPGNRNYQGIILGEYLITIALIALTPIATGGSATAQAKQSPSPYAATDLQQLVAVSAVYFILAIISSGSRGRIAAWFGGIILLATLISKAGQAQLTAVITAIAQPPSGGGGGGSTLA